MRIEVTDVASVVAARLRRRRKWWVVRDYGTPLKMCTIVQLIDSLGHSSAHEGKPREGIGHQWGMMARRHVPHSPRVGKWFPFHQIDLYIWGVGNYFYSLIYLRAATPHAAMHSLWICAREPVPQAQ